MNLELNIDEESVIVGEYITPTKYKCLEKADVKEMLQKYAKENFTYVSIVNGTLKIKVKSMTILIKNYNYNEDKYIQTIIDKAILIRKEKRKQALKKKKIERNKKILKKTAIFAVTSVVALSSLNALGPTLKDKIEDIYKSDKIEKIDNKQTADNTLDNILLKDEEELEKTETNESKADSVYNVEFESRTDTTKYKKAKSNYKRIITDISEKYGIDPRIILGIATQERGIHSSVRDKCAIGLMQIELSVWDNQQLSGYNYKTKCNETINITEKKLGNLEFNITTACMIFQQCLTQSNNNIPLAIQMYNYGQGNVKKMLRICAQDKQTSISTEMDNKNCDWTQYRDHIKAGDKCYLERILSYMEDTSNIKCIVGKDKQKEISCNITNKTNDNILKNDKV